MVDGLDRMCGWRVDRQAGGANDGDCGRCSVPPPLPDTDDCERDDGADDEKADDGHAPIKVTPPPGTLISCLVDDVLLVSEGGVDGAEMVLAVFDLEHLALGVGGEWKEGSNHPR